MNHHLTPLGRGDFYRDDRSGIVVIDGDSVRRAAFSGEESSPYYGYEGPVIDPGHFGAFDPYEANDFEFGYHAPYMGGYGDPGFGAWNDSRRRNRQDYPNRPPQRQPYPVQPARYPQHPQAPAPAPGLPPVHPSQVQAARNTLSDIPSGWAMTAVNGSTTLDAPGAATVAIRVQHDFIAHDITLEGSAPGATVTSIYFGARPVWSSPSGIPASVFGINSYIRGLLKGQSINAGLDITVTGVLTSSGNLAVSLFGVKPNE